MAHRARGKVAGRLPGRRPALSVVVPVYNVGDWIRPAMESLVTQTLADLEIIVVDDGSTDGSIGIVREYAARDDRISIVTKENAGLGAARNTGAEHATGEFIAFFDSDDLVMPDAYQAMVEQLRRSGSDFVTGVFERGDESASVRPNWVRRTMGRNRTGITLVDEPDLLLDITAWNKVFRRSFWRRHDFRFVEGVRYEDQVPITRAYLTARSFDVLRQRVYIWRTRLDGSSITQQKSSIADLRDRLRSQVECAEMMREAPELIRETWYLKLLDYDFPNYLMAALNADPDYVKLLFGRLERLRTEVPPHVWSRVAFRNRAKSWVLSHGRLDLGVELRAWFERDQTGLPTVDRGDHLAYAPPFEISDEDLPDWVCRIYEVDVRPVVRLVGATWEDHELVLRGSAYLAPLPRDFGSPTLELHLVTPEGERLEVPVSRYADLELDHLARMAFADMSDTGFEARIDGDWLAKVAPEGQASLLLEFTQRQGDFERVSNLTHVVPTCNGASREPRNCNGRMVRLAGVVDTGHRLLVHDTWAWSSSHRVLDDSTLELTLEVPASDPPTRAWLARRGEPNTPVPLEVRGDGTALVRLQPGSGQRLRTRHASGVKLDVLWAEEPNVLGSNAVGGFVHRGPAQNVLVGEPLPAAAISEVIEGERSLVVRGTTLAAAGGHLYLRGPRSTGLPSAPLPAGDFEVELPLEQDPWGLGRTPLTAGLYLLALEPADATDHAPGHPAGAPSGDAEESSYVFASTSLRRRLPLAVDQSPLHAEVGTSHLCQIEVWSRPLPQSEASPRQRQRLRTEVYPEAIAAPRLPCVLFEAFNGTSTGDSLAAIARELLRRDAGLDLVWSIADSSVAVPPGTRGVVRQSREWYELLGRAAYVVNNANFPFYFRKAPGQVYLQTWHGTPLKRIANDMEDTRYLSVTYRRTMVYEASVWDFLISPSPFCSEIFPRAFDYHGKLLESGYPRNEALVGPGREERRQDVRRRLGIAEDQRVLLYAPTWRETARSGGSHSKVLYLDAREVVEAVPGTVVLVRGHANTSGSGSVAGDGSSKVIDVTLYPDINDLYLASDALVTDYSSVMFDYALLDRPMMFLVPDLVDYRDRLRGFYFDFEATAPGPLFSDQEALVQHLRDAAPSGDDHAADDHAPDDYAAARAAFRDRFTPWDDAGTTGRVVDAVFGPSA